MMGQHDPRRVKDQALGHRARLRILDLYTEDEGRSLEVDDLLADLKARFGEEFKDANRKQIYYHRGRLQLAGLLPS